MYNTNFYVYFEKLGEKPQEVACKSLKEAEAIADEIAAAAKAAGSLPYALHISEECETIKEYETLTNEEAQAALIALVISKYEPGEEVEQLKADLIAGEGEAVDAVASALHFHKEAVLSKQWEEVFYKYFE